MQHVSFSPIGLSERKPPVRGARQAFERLYRKIPTGVLSHQAAAVCYL